MALGDADLGLSPLVCASVCAGQLLRCTISPALQKGTWLSGPRAYLGLRFRLMRLLNAESWSPVLSEAGIRWARRRSARPGT